MGCPSGSLEGKFKGTNYGDNHHEFWSKVWQQDPSDIYDGKYLVTIIEPTPSNSNWTWTYGMYIITFFVCHKIEYVFINFSKKI